MKLYKFLLLIMLSGGLFTACSDDTEDFEKTEKTEGETKNDLEVEGFIYRGMNDLYLYKKDVAVLADGYFSTEAEKNDYLDNFSSPEDLFEKLMASQDEYSYLMENYEEHGKAASGPTTTGMSYGLVKYSNTSNNVLGYVRFVFPNTSAEEEGVERGMIFNKVDGQQLTISNINTLLNSDSFTIGLADLEGNTIRDTDETIALTKGAYEENPVVISKVLDIDGEKIGYLHYDSFDLEYDEDLNNAFGDFKAENITDLVLDLRYNGGGSVRSAVDLASMITGQFPDDLFMKEQWNEKYQKYYEENEPEALLNNFNTETRSGTAINSLNLERVYVLTTKASASASELIINGLEPYIDVIQVGDWTTGKFQASATLYDSPNFDKDHSELNTDHKYAMQPLILKSMNKNGVSDYVNGLEPDLELREDLENLGILGEQDEPLLSAALNARQGNKISTPANVKTYKTVGESGMEDPNYQNMFIDRIPTVIKE